jgi:hypothetical protein
MACLMVQQVLLARLVQVQSVMWVGGLRGPWAGGSAVMTMRMRQRLVLVVVMQETLPWLAAETQGPVSCPVSCMCTVQVVELGHEQQGWQHTLLHLHHQVLQVLRELAVSRTCGPAVVI